MNAFWFDSSLKIQCFLVFLIKKMLSGFGENSIIERKELLDENINYILNKFLMKLIE